MRSNSNGPATFLMFLALAAMAAVGVFGLPQFPPVVASAPDANDDELPDDFASFEPSRSGESAAQGVEDLFAAVETPDDERLSPDDEAFPAMTGNRGGGAAAKERGIVDLLAAAELESEDLSQPAAGNPDAESRSLDSKFDSPPFGNDADAGRTADTATQSPLQQRDPRTTGLDSRFGRPANADSMPASFATDAQAQPARGTQAPPQRPSVRSGVAGVDPALVRVADAGGGTADAAAGKPLTWQSAVERLRALGITHYRLAPGTAPNEFHFSCFFSPGGDPRITQRFEAEANEPLGAVERVLAQLDGWRSQQAENRTNRQTADLAGPIDGNAVADRSPNRQ